MIQKAEAIRKMCADKKAVILAHYYTNGEIQDVADFVGDSLALARKAAETDAEIIVMCGYVNTTAAVKALTDIVVTSGNARKVVDSLPADAEILFGPDRNLGAYINSVTGRQMHLWEGGCHVHERFSPEAIVSLKAQHPDAPVLVHPECKSQVVAMADVVGSTAVLLSHAAQSDQQEFIVCTESGILHEMQRQCPNKTFIPVPPEVGEGTIGCHCNECSYMKLNTIDKLYDTLLNETPEITIDADIAEAAVRPIQRMLEIK